VFSLFLTCDPASEDRLTADLWEQETAGVSDEPGGLRAFFEDVQRVPELIEQFRDYSPELRLESDTDWEQVSRDAFPPLPIGERFFLVSPWSDAPTPNGRLRLEIYPGMACGTGRHPATQLCLEAMERHVQPGATVVDVGAGSGILSAAAQLLGASPVIGCDIDPEAVEIARSRVDAVFFIGSLDAVRSEVADVIVANISSAAVEQLRPEFERVRIAGGKLILAGFPASDLPEGFAPQEILQREEWVCYVVY
jgi:ribosomal protein L11 methyltransferase